MIFFNFLNFDNISLNIIITYFFTYLISLGCAYLPFSYYLKRLDHQELSNLVPILLKSYFGSIVLTTVTAFLSELLKGVFFMNSNDIWWDYIIQIPFLTILFIILYFKIKYYTSYSYLVRDIDTDYYISNEENDKKRENYINTLKLEQTAKKRSYWLIFKKIGIYSFFIFCFCYLSLAIFVAYVMFG